MPDDWKIYELQDICHLKTGGTPSKNHPEYFGGNIKWMVSGDIHKEFIYDVDGRITQIGYENSNARYLPINSVLIALNGQGKTRGTVAILKTEATCNQSLIAFISKNGGKLDYTYLFYYLKSCYQKLRNLTGDNERSGLSMRVLKPFPIVAPPLEIQQKIVDKLDKQMTQIEIMGENAERQKHTMNCLYKAYLQNMYSNMYEYQNKKIGDLFETRYGLSKPSVNDPTKIPAVRMSNISYEGDLFLDELTYLDLSETELNKHKLKINDLLFNRTNSAELVGKTTVFDCDDTFVSVSYIVVATPKTNEINSKYVAFYLNNPEMKKYFTENCNRAISQANFSATKLSNIDIPIPNLNVQNEIVHKIENMKRKISNTKQIIDNQLNAINQLPESILNDVFGKYALPDEV